MNDPNPFISFALFLGMWLGVSAIISMVGGWFWVSKKFPLSEQAGPILESYSWNSLNLNYLAAYKSCMNIKITNNGMILQPSFIFSFLHFPIFIPWGVIKDYQYKERIFQKSIFYVGSNRFVIYGNVANMMNKYLRTQHNNG